MTKKILQKKEKDEKKGIEKEAKKVSEYNLVLWMLASLTFLLLLLIGLPLLAPIIVKDTKEFIEYCKWVFPALLGAFGAWIGAGAAYFFGKENLKLSSQSTQEALETQQKMSRMNLGKTLIKDINLTPLNPNFLFNMNDPVSKVITKLDENVDYWFVPVLDDEKNEKIKDIIHTEAFWRFLIDNPKKDLKDVKISEIFIYIKEKLKSKVNKLHGFFLLVRMDYNVEDVLKEMNTSEASVGIVCNENGKPTHCFSRKDLRSFLLGS